MHTRAIRASQFYPTAGMRRSPRLPRRSTQMGRLVGVAAAVRTQEKAQEYERPSLAESAEEDPVAGRSRSAIGNAGVARRAAPAAGPGGRGEDRARRVGDFSCGEGRAPRSRGAWLAPCRGELAQWRGARRDGGGGGAPCLDTKNNVHASRSLRSGECLGCALSKINLCLPSFCLALRQRANARKDCQMADVFPKMVKKTFKGTVPAGLLR